eukprot:scaffold50546_cov54-Phaeocystis_antarctica.AAC.1
MGELRVTNAAADAVWSLSGDQGNSWQAATVEVYSPSFGFEYTCGSSYTGDAAVALVAVSCGATPPLPPLSPPPPPSLPPPPLSPPSPPPSPSTPPPTPPPPSPPSPPSPPPPPPSPPSPPSPPLPPPSQPTTIFDFSGGIAAGLGWSTGGADPATQAYAFNKREGGTSSGGTGPSAGVGGSGSYVYAETSSPR